MTLYPLLQAAVTYSKEFSAAWALMGAGIGAGIAVIGAGLGIGRDCLGERDEAAPQAFAVAARPILVDVSGQEIAGVQGDCVAGATDALLAAAEQAGAPIRRIALTHGHMDHVGSLDALRELGGEGVVHTRLDQHPVGADAGLAGVAVLARDGAGHRGAGREQTHGAPVDT